MLIYSVINKINNHRYIGITTRSLEERQSQHFYCAFTKKQKNYFYRALRKYKWVNFEWVILELVDSVELLLEKEVFYIEKYNTFNGNGYNETIGGRGTFGWKHSEETKEKIREAGRKRKGMKFSDEHKKNIGKARLNKSYEQIFGYKKAKELKERKSCSYEEKFGLEQTKKIKEKQRTFYYNNLKVIGKKREEGKKKGKKPEWGKEAREKAKKLKMGNKNPMYKEMPNEDIEKLIKLYQGVLTNEIINQFEYSNYILKKTLQQKGLWKKVILNK